MMRPSTRFIFNKNLYQNVRMPEAVWQSVRITMRKILKCDKDNEITVSGEGIEYRISRSAITIPEIKIEPEILARIEKELDTLARIDTRASGTVLAFKENLKNGKLSLRDRGGYGWLNSWCYTPSTRSYGRGHDYVKSLEKTLFGFEIGEKIWGETSGKRIDPGVDYIFNLAYKKIHEKYGSCPFCKMH